MCWAKSAFLVAEAKADLPGTPLNVLAAGGRRKEPGRLQYRTWTKARLKPTYRDRLCGDRLCETGLNRVELDRDRLDGTKWRKEANPGLELEVIPRQGSRIQDSGGNGIPNHDAKVILDNRRHHYSAAPAR